MYEKTRVVALCETGRVNLPFTSVIVPTVVPFTVTDTPGIVPSPLTEEVTVPVIVFCWENEDRKNPQKTKNNKRILFMVHSD
jgi:hypothetical protein